MNETAEKLKYAAAVAIYGTIGLFVRQISLPVEIIVVCRGLIGSLFILVYLLIRKKTIDRAAIKKNIKWLVISGLALGLNWVFLFAAYRHTTVASATVLYYMAPVFFIALSPLAFNEKLNFKKLICFVAAVLGMVFISGIMNGGIEGLNITGTLFGLLAALCFTGVLFCNKKMTEPEPYGKTLVQLAISAAAVFPYAVFANTGTPIFVDLRSALFTLLLGVVHTGIAYCLYFDAIGKLRIQTVAVMGYIDPAVSVLCSTVILGESISVYGWIGSALIIGAAVISEIIK